MSASAEEADRPVGPRSRKGELTRARLLEAAKAVFEEDGFLEARITDIAERAGLSHGSFYHYFDSKEQIFREVADALVDRLNAPLGDVIFASNAPVGPRDRIREGNRSFLESYKEDARLINEVEQAARYDKALHEERTRHQLQYNKQLASSIRGLIRRGLADPLIDPGIAAHVIGAMVTRFADLWFVQGVVESTFDEAVDQLTRLVGNALGLPDEEAPPVRKAGRKAS